VNTHKRRYESLRKLIDARLRSLVKKKQPEELTDACRYVLSAGGKKIRSTLTLLSCEAVGGNVLDAVEAGMAIELMHNFTLVHDDVMDHAASRRGRATVHTKWNVNNALLVGDVLLGLAYQRALKSNAKQLQRMLEVFTQGLLDVCEGQALDLEFEQRADVTLDDYFSMIEKKTGRLLATSAELGGLIGNGSQAQIGALRKFGHYLGRAFQLQDDLLDVVAEEKAFGKTIGGDIREGKKTFLLLKALQSARGSDRAVLRNVMSRNSAARHNTTSLKQEIARVTAIYHETGAIADARNRIRRDTMLAAKALDSLPRSHAREMLLWLSEMLVRRNF